MVEVETWFSVWFWLNVPSARFVHYATEVTNQEFQKKGSEVYEDWKVSLRWIKIALHITCFALEKMDIKVHVS